MLHRSQTAWCSRSIRFAATPTALRPMANIMARTDLPSDAIVASLAVAIGEGVQVVLVVLLLLERPIVLSVDRDTIRWVALLPSLRLLMELQARLNLDSEGFHQSTRSFVSLFLQFSLFLFLALFLFLFLVPCLASLLREPHLLLHGDRSFLLSCPFPFLCLLQCLIHLCVVLSFLRTAADRAALWDEVGSLRMSLKVPTVVEQ